MTTLLYLDADLPTDWHTGARCRAADAEVFFAPAHFEHKAERLAREAKAKAVCAGCPVRRECLHWALATREPYGVWGGHSERERREILLGRRKAS